MSDFRSTQPKERVKNVKQCVRNQLYRQTTRLIFLKFTLNQTLKKEYKQKCFEKYLK